MPPIPTINSSASVATGSTGPRADASSFGGGQGLAALGQGMSNLGAGVGAAGGVLANKQAREKAKAEAEREQQKLYSLNNVQDVRNALKLRENQDAAAWMVQAGSQYVKEISAFSLDSGNRSSETFPKDIEEFASKRADEFLAKAPNEEAAKSFRNYSTQTSTQYFLDAQSHSERLRLSRLQSNVGEQVTNVMAEFRANLQTVGDGKASIILNNRVSTLLAGAEDTFGFMPETLAKVESDIYESVIIGSMEDSPELARDLLDQAPFDEQKRKVLEAQIDSAINETNYADQIAFAEANAVELQRAKESGDIAEEVPVSAFESVLGDKKKAFVEYKRFESERRAVNFHNASMQSLRGKNLQTIDSDMASLKDNVFASGDLDLINGYYSLVGSVTALRDEMFKDGASYVTKYNPFVQRQVKSVENSIFPEEKAAESQKLMRMIKEFQGHAPEEATEEQSKLYLGLPTQRRHVLTEPRAKQWVDRFNNSSLNEKVLFIDNFEKEFEDVSAGSEEANSKMFAWAFSDLVSIGELPQEVQAAFMAKGDPALVRQILSSTENQKAIASLNPEKVADYSTAVLDNDKWKAFQRTRTGSNKQNAPEVAGFAKAIRNVALSLDDLTPDDAAERAIEKILGRNLGFIEVQDTTIAIPKKRYPGNPDRTDEDFLNIQTGLNSLLRFFPVQFLNPSDPRINVGLADTETKREIQSLAIANGGFWVPTQDGQSMTLYVRPFSPGGTPLNEEAFELTDINNKPFEVDIDSYETKEIELFSGGAGVEGFSGSTSQKIKTVNYNALKFQGRFR